jgi:hypothetical protein
MQRGAGVDLTECLIDDLVDPGARRNEGMLVGHGAALGSVPKKHLAARSEPWARSFIRGSSYTQDQEKRDEKYRW